MNPRILDIDATVAGPPEFDVEELIAILAREGDVLERLVRRVTVLALLLGSGDGRFLAPAADEVDAAADDLGELEIHREVAAHDVAERLGLTDGDLTLRRVIAAAPAAYRPALETQHERLSTLMAELQRRLAEAGGLADSGMGGIQVRLERLATGSRDLLYGRSGPLTAPPPTRFDERA